MYNIAFSKIWIRREICTHEAPLIKQFKTVLNKYVVDFDVRGQLGFIIMDLYFCIIMDLYIVARSDGFVSYKHAAFYFTRH